MTLVDDTTTRVRESLGLLRGGGAEPSFLAQTTFRSVYDDSAQTKARAEVTGIASLQPYPCLVQYRGTCRNRPRGRLVCKKRVETLSSVLFPNLVVANDLFNAVILSTYGAKNNLHWTVILFLQSMLYTLL